MNTLRDRFCATHGCEPAAFERHVLWRCLHRRALGPLILLRPQAEYFSADRELIAEAGRARTMGELHEEIRDFARDARNRGWWRGRMHVRLSTRRLRAFARRYLPVASEHVRDVGVM